MTPLVLLPGMMCDARLFAPQVEALGDLATVTVGDLAGADTVEALAAAVLARAPERFALLGLSMGGIVALSAIALAPERVTRLALLDTNHRAETPERRAAREPQMRRARDFLREVIVEEMKPNYLGAGHADDPALLDLCLSMALDLGPEVFLRQSRALRDRPDRTEALRRYPGPVLVLCGAEDKLCPPERHREMAALARSAELVVVPGSGHLSTLEEPEAVNAALRRWLAGEPSLRSAKGRGLGAPA